MKVAGADGTGRRTVLFHSRPHTPAGDQPWLRNATGTLSPARPDADGPGGAPRPDAPWPPEAAVPLRADGPESGPYERLAAEGLRYGPAFRGMSAAWRHGEELYADVALPEAARTARRAADGPGFVLHPALLDAALHAVALDSLVANNSGAAAEAADGLALPFAFSGVRVHTAGVRRLRVRVVPGPDGRSGVELTDDTGSPVATVRSLALRRLPRTGPTTGADAVTGTLHRLDWVVSAEPSAPVALPRWGFWARRAPVWWTLSRRRVPASRSTRARRRATRRRPSSWHPALRTPPMTGATGPPLCCGRRTGRWGSYRNGSPSRACPAPVSSW